MLETGMIEPHARDLLTDCFADFKGYFEGSQQLVQEPREFFCCIHRCFRLEDELAAMEARAVQESIDESVPRLIAATQEAIQALQITEIEVGCDDPCMICLEELEPSTTVIKRMPCCSHLFHGDCIEQWLNTSHLCPWCRFPMPISAEED
ncbi:hypothetical protein SLEP1_g1499 [Rubroshorea leprosula]|uniref:RING-type E3 ubiquitin transferase n=1 Tax=Rubroshorea leprosula TaxID=152421 RepID=A0AAV5HN31_9ROSI|nr:hypothetical protein SLEP1_g1499 [Rubroshorea leprosula]